jgi:hypothetical protein
VWVCGALAAKVVFVTLLKWCRRHYGYQSEVLLRPTTCDYEFSSARVYHVTPIVFSTTRAPNSTENYLICGYGTS